MIYGTLSNDELERIVYCNPGNEQAKAELLSRVTGLLDQNDQDLVDAKERIEELEKDFESKCEELERAEDELGVLDEKLLEANSRIHELTDITDLV